MIPKEKTQRYVHSLAEIIKRYDKTFSVVPLSFLYKKYALSIQENLRIVEQRIGEEVYNEPGFQKLTINARKNIATRNDWSENKVLERSKEAARSYIVHRVAEENAQIFKDYKDCIRSFFIKYTPFYKKYITNVAGTEPELDCSLIFYTGSKGNITQPWQAVGEKKVNGKIAFLSQNRSKLQLKIDNAT